MGKLTELEQWEDDVYQIETSDPVLGGPDGISNRPQKQLANRTLWLKKQLECANNALAEHEKSRNHPDATLTDKGFVRLYSGVTSMDETMAATPKAVKIAMDNASARLAKERNLADLPSIPLALANLTLADVKKYVESTNTGVSKLPQFRPSSEDDLTSLPAGYMALAQNKTPGGPLPDENWFYLEVAGNLDNPSNNPNRKGGVIRLTQVSNPGISWTGVKFDDATTTTAKFKWARDFNTLNKPTPEDVGLAATKKAIDDTQTGLAAQGVMWISTADDLSNLPSGAHRFARNNTGVTVLPTENYCYVEVLAKRDVANGTCIKVVDYADPGNIWTGTRSAVPDEAMFKWVRQYTESYKPPQQALPDSLLRGNNLSDLTDAPKAVEYLGLTETVNKAAGAMQRDQNGADIPDKPLFVKTLGIVDSYPVGCPIPYPGPTAPDGYLLMDGRPFSKTLYPQLAKLYVDGVLPDMRGMFIRGWDNGRGLDTPNGYAGRLRSLIGDDSSRADMYKNEFYSLRGYRIYIDGINKPYEDNKRALLKPQYLDSVISDREPDTNRLLHLDHYNNPRYSQSVPSGQYQKDVENLEYKPSVSGISFYRRTAPATDAFIPDYENNGMVRLGSPNVTFNYITKAA
ncbi:tail fiber protein [Salmonella enterica]|nr:tail fiber protein [Salmonella enterica]